MTLIHHLCLTPPSSVPLGQGGGFHDLFAHSNSYLDHVAFVTWIMTPTSIKSSMVKEATAGPQIHEIDKVIFGIKNLDGNYEYSRSLVTRAETVEESSYILTVCTGNLLDGSLIEGALLCKSAVDQFKVAHLYIFMYACIYTCKYVRFLWMYVYMYGCM